MQSTVCPIPRAHCNAVALQLCNTVNHWSGLRLWCYRKTGLRPAEYSDTCLSLSQSLIELLAVVCYIVLYDMHSLGSGSTQLRFWSWSCSCNLGLAIGLVGLILVWVSWFDFGHVYITAMNTHIHLIDYKTNTLYAVIFVLIFLGLLFLFLNATEI